MFDSRQEIKKKFNDLIIQLRGKRGKDGEEFKQKALAKRLGCNETMVSQWRNGHVNMSDKTIAKICNALKNWIDITPDYFFDDETSTVKDTGNDAMIEHIVNYNNLIKKELNELQNRVKEIENQLKKGTPLSKLRKLR